MSNKSHTFAYPFPEKEKELITNYINDVTADDSQVDSPNFQGFVSLNLITETKENEDIFKLVGVTKAKSQKVYLVQEKPEETEETE